MQYCFSASFSSLVQQRDWKGTTFILNHCTPPSRGPRLCLALDNGGRAAFNIPVHKQVPQLWSRTKTRCLGFLFCPVQRYRAAPLAHRNLTDTSLSSSSSKERWCSISFVGFIVVACKFIGLAREIVTAARFGVGLVVDSYSHAALVPSFFCNVIGGLNGPVHCALATALSTQSDRATSRRIVDCLVTFITITAFVLSLSIFFSSGFIIRCFSPGLHLLSSLTATTHLRMMAPCIFLAAFNVISMARLTSISQLGLSVFTPAISSLTIVAVISQQFITDIFRFCKVPSYLYKAENLLALGTLLGSFFQYVLLRVFSRSHYKSGSFLLSSLASCGSQGLRASLSMLLQACMTSGMLQIASSTDTFFASFLPHAAAGIGYSSLLASTPLGILSTSLLVSLVPQFALHSDPVHWHLLRSLLGKVLVGTFVFTSLVVAIVIPLANPIVTIVFERQAFDTQACELVSTLFSLYMAGGVFSIVRDLILRVFYVIGDGDRPLRISFLAVSVNLFLDWFFTFFLSCGAQGIVISTVITTCLTSLILARELIKKIGVIKIDGLFISTVKVLFASVLCSGTTGYVHFILDQQFAPGLISSNTHLGNAVLLCISAICGTLLYFFALVLSGFDPLPGFRQ
mmetsp:Transcript_115254/g.279652  ORF Transcript_115254/g.279652 Transcript_115254/m.279652 type:complete len:628 (-) Transcript_115254:1153-3036(-)